MPHLVDKHLLRDLHKPGWGAFRLFLIYGIIAHVLFGAIYWAVVEAQYALLVPLVLAQSFVMHAFLIAFHEASHGGLAPVGWLNGYLGRVIGISSWMSLTLYRAAHHWHHAYLGDKRDEEFWPLNDPAAGKWKRRLAAFLELFCGLAWTPFLFVRAFLRRDTAIRDRAIRRLIWVELIGLAALLGYGVEFGVLVRHDSGVSRGIPHPGSARGELAESAEVCRACWLNRARVRTDAKCAESVAIGAVHRLAAVPGTVSRRSPPVSEGAAGGATGCRGGGEPRAAGTAGVLHLHRGRSSTCFADLAIPSSAKRGRKHRVSVTASRSRFTHSAIRLSASSISSSVCVGAKLNRSAERNTSSVTPIARSTGLGNRLPLEHADPVEHATPAKSSAINRRSARQPRKDTFNVVGTTSAAPVSGPFSTTRPHNRCNPYQNRLRSASNFARFSVTFRTATSNATAAPTASATGSVPGRRPFC